QTTRDQAVSECAAFVTRFGERFAPKSAEEPSGLFEEARLVFPQLDKPALDEAVKNARAIFSLEGKGNTHRLPMPKYPMRAKWTALFSYPTVNYINVLDD